jgi:DNA-binding NarL/FixJ family response regulator
MGRPTHNRVLAVEAPPVFIDGLAAIIASQLDIVRMAQPCPEGTAIAGLRAHLPNVILMVRRLPETNGTNATIAILTGQSAVRQ